MREEQRGELQLASALHALWPFQSRAAHSAPRKESRIMNIARANESREQSRQQELHKQGAAIPKRSKSNNRSNATCSKSNDKANSLSTRQGHKGLVVQGASKTSEWLAGRRKHERNGEESYTEQIPSAWPSTGMRVDSLIMRTSWLEPRGMTNCPHMSAATTNNKQQDKRMVA